MKIYSLINFSFLYALTAFSHALTVKIDKTAVRTTQLQSCSDSSYLEIKYYSISIKGRNQEHLDRIDKYKADENIEIESYRGTVSLPLIVSQRLLKLLQSGWQSVLKYEPLVDVPVGFCGMNPSCSFIMFYVAFGNSDFSTESFSIEGADELESEFSLVEAVSELEIGDIVILSGVNSRFNKNATYYLDNNLFLTWDSYSAIFRFQDSEQIHSSFEGRYKLLILRKRRISPADDDNSPTRNASILDSIVKNKEVVLPHPIEPFSYVK